MHVDGFRFDLATILSRDRQGNISADPPLPARIAEDPLLRTAKLIAEPWDMAGYQVGQYPGGRWAEWNDRYRDEIRQYWRGDPGLTGALTTRLAGSANLYYPSGRSPNHSINFVAAHDGFTLNDVVSYNTKHNKANGEQNRDGHNYNFSFNYGIEGPTNDPEIETIRNRQVKNFLATLMLSQGTPILNGGDEFRRTQQGNNNAYCQHNEISWYDWSFLEKHADIYRFTRYVIAQRKAHPVFRRTTFLHGRDFDGNNYKDIHWYSSTGKDTEWDPTDQRLMYLLDGAKEETGAAVDDVNVLMMFNADDRSHLFYLPPAPHNGRWYIMLDTAQPSPEDIYPPGKEAELEPAIGYPVQSRSMVVLISKWADIPQK